MLRNMFKKTYTKIDTKFRPQTKAGEEPAIPQGMWRKCNKCGQPIYVEDVMNNYYVWPKIDGYFLRSMPTAGSRCWWMRGPLRSGIRK